MKKILAVVAVLLCAAVARAQAPEPGTQAVLLGKLL